MRPDGTFELPDGRRLPVVAEFDGHDYVAHVVHDVEAAYEYLITWTDGVNSWLEGYHFPWLALARLAALIAACEQDVWLVHDSSTQPAFEDEANRFIGRTVHAFNCPPGCRGDSPMHDEYR